MSSLQQLKTARIVWPAASTSAPKKQAYQFQQAKLDEALQGGVAPYGLSVVQGELPCGELSLLIPVIKQALAKKPYLALINPPGVPNSDWFSQQLCASEHLFYISDQSNQEHLWAFEQCIMAGACGAVISWNVEADAKQLRRCHIRAIRHQCQAIWLTSHINSAANIPCNLILNLARQEQQWFADIHKQQGGWPRANIPINHPLPLSNKAIVKAMHHLPTQGVSSHLV